MATSELLHTAHYILDREFEPHRKPPLASIPAAGIGTQANAVSTADCLHFPTRPGTPEHEKKYRQSALHEPGKIVRCAQTHCQGLQGLCLSTRLSRS